MATSRLRRRLQQPRLRRQPLKRRLPATVVVSKAQQVCEDYVVESLRRGIDPQPPVVDGQWVRRWRVDRGVSFRKPNRKWKVPKDVLLERCQIFWSNVFRVRAFIFAKFGYDPPCGTSAKPRTT